MKSFSPVESLGISSLFTEKYVSRPTSANRFSCTSLAKSCFGFQKRQRYNFNDFFWTPHARSNQSYSTKKINVDSAFHKVTFYYKELKIPLSSFQSLELESSGWQLNNLCSSDVRQHIFSESVETVRWCLRVKWSLKLKLKFEDPFSYW